MEGNGREWGIKLMDCVVYRSAKKEETYLYVRVVDDKPDMDSVPEKLRQLLGELQEVIGLDLSADRKLARVDVKEVMEKLKSEGYYLQIPPGPEVTQSI